MQWNELNLILKSVNTSKFMGSEFYAFDIADIFRQSYIPASKW